MTRLHEQITTRTPLEETFGYAADFTNLREWDPGIAESAKIGDGPVAAGTQFDVIVSFGARRIPMVYTITEFDPPNRVVLVGKGSSLTAVDELTFAKVPEGTVITYTADLKFKGVFGLIAPLMSPTLKTIGRNAIEGLAEALSTNEAPAGS